jgi:hypothetical protein
VAVTVERLVRLLDAAAGVDEWIAVESRVRSVSRSSGARPVRSDGEVVSLSAVILRDSEQGRGSARLWLDGEDADDARAQRLIAVASERAALTLGPAWTLPAPAAPAQVTVADAELERDPTGAVDRAMAQVNAAQGRLAAIGRARIEVQVHSHAAETSRGFASQYTATTALYDLAAGVGSESRSPLERVRGCVRSAAQLSLHRRIADAARAASRRKGARPLQPGRYDLLLRPAAIAGPGAGLDRSAGAAAYGWFAPLVAHADAERVRLGISHHRPGQPVFAAAGREGVGRGAAPRAGDVDVFTLASDGTIDFGLLSAPFGELGEPVRRFEIVRDGLAAGLALDHREAALAHTTPNGGVRNLVLDAGRTPAAGLAAPGQRPLLEVAQLSWIDCDPRSGALTAGIGAATVRGAAVTGGLVVGNAFDLLGRARLSAETGTLAWYRGPIALRIDSVDVTV